MCICRDIPFAYSVAVIMAVVEGCIFLLAFRQVVCVLRSLSIMGGIQNLIICVKMAWSEHLDCGVNIR